MDNVVKDIILSPEPPKVSSEIFGITEETEKEDGFWTGKVVDVDDPLMLGRVKIKVFGHYDSIKNENLPWACREDVAIGSTKGTFIVPELGSIVRGYFDKGDEQKPIYTALAFNTNKVASSKAFAEIKLNYPNVMTLLETDSGELITLNKSTGELKIVHRTGTVLSIASTGTIDVTTTRSLLGIQNDDSSSLNLNIDNNILVESNAGNINITAQKGNINVNSVGGEVNLGENAVDKIINGKVVKSITKQLVNNLPVCLVTGAKHCIGNTNVKC